jgi:hypothetical protein
VRPALFFIVKKKYKKKGLGNAHPALRPARRADNLAAICWPFV